MQLAHAGDHHFLGLRVAVDAEGRVLLGDLVQGAGELGFVAAALGRDGQADHRRGKWIGGMANSPSVTPVCKSSILATATISPGPASSTGSVSLACTWNNWADLDPLARADGVDRFVLLQRAARRRG